jgi:hypothetical protein
MTACSTNAISLPNPKKRVVFEKESIMLVFASNSCPGEAIQAEPHRLPMLAVPKDSTMLTTIAFVVVVEKPYGTFMPSATKGNATL